MGNAMLHSGYRQKGQRSLRRGLRCNSGVAAVEFAMIAPLFFLMMFASVEVGLSYFANMTLENGVLETARLIRTGQAQQNAMSADEFRDALCDEIDYMLSCDADTLSIDVRSFSNLGSAGYASALDGDGNLSGDLNGFETGQSSATPGAQGIVLVRAFYKWELFTPMFSHYYSNMPNDDRIRLVTSSFAFRNEPY
jgi:Flp pilus assembly protein TadG